MKQSGLTLVEVLVAMGIVIVVGVLLVAIIVNSAGLYSKESAKLSQGLNANDSLAAVRETIKESSGIMASYTSGTTYTSGSNQIVFNIISLDSSNNLIPNTHDYFVFYLDTNKLRLKTFPDPLSSRKAQDQIFSTSVDSLTFQYLSSANPPVEVAPTSATRIRITLTLKQKNGPSIELKTATTEAIIRND